MQEPVMIDAVYLEHSLDGVLTDEWPESSDDQPVLITEGKVFSWLDCWRCDLAVTGHGPLAKRWKKLIASVPK